VWVFDRRRGVLACEHPKRVAAENYFYTTESPDSISAAAIESFLAENVEGPFWPVLDRLEKKEMPTSTDRSHLTIFAAFLLTRVPASRDFYANVVYKTIVSYPDLRSIVELLDGVLKTSGGGILIPNTSQNDTLHQMGKLGIEVAQHLGTLDMHFMYSPVDEPFITSDNPFVLDQITNDNQPPSLSATSYMKWIPLSAKLAVGFGLPGNLVTHMNLESIKARNANVRLATAARQIVIARSREQLEQILSIIPKQTPDGAASFPSVVV
jgi:hypothetical protein